SSRSSRSRPTAGSSRSGSSRSLLRIRDFGTHRAQPKSSTEAEFDRSRSEEAGRGGVPPPPDRHGILRGPDRAPHRADQRALRALQDPQEGPPFAPRPAPDREPAPPAARLSASHRAGALSGVDPATRPAALAGPLRPPPNRGRPFSVRPDTPATGRQGVAPSGVCVSALGEAEQRALPFPDPASRPRDSSTARPAASRPFRIGIRPSASGEENRERWLPTGSNPTA